MQVLRSPIDYYNIDKIRDKYSRFIIVRFFKNQLFLEIYFNSILKTTTNKLQRGIVVSSL